MLWLLVKIAIGLVLIQIAAVVMLIIWNAFCEAVER